MMLRRAISFLGLAALLSTAAIAEKRVALVIGNSAYQFTSKLANPTNDATDMAAALKKHGFQVIDGLDLDKAAFDRKVREFATALKDSEAGLFFYAGHGFQVGGQNYLVPIDAKAEGAEALEFEMVRVDMVHRIMERLSNTNILFLDACRDNPMARNLARSMGTRSSEVGKGLAAVESGVGTLISFSTQPGNVAFDGKGRNSPFAGALIRQLKDSSDDLGAILIAVRNEVMQETQRKQVPWEHSALTGRFFFTPPKATPPRPPAAVDTAPKVSRGFDGIWSVTLTCDKTPDGALGYTRRLVAKVKDGELIAEIGQKGKPSWLVFQGSIDSNGVAIIRAHGMVGSNRYAIGGAKQGDQVSYGIIAHFETTRGTGARKDGRDCSLLFIKER